MSKAKSRYSVENKLVTHEVIKSFDDTETGKVYKAVKPLGTVTAASASVPFAILAVLKTLVKAPLRVLEFSARKTGKYAYYGAHDAACATAYSTSSYRYIHQDFLNPEYYYFDTLPCSTIVQDSTMPFLKSPNMVETLENDNDDDKATISIGVRGTPCYLVNADGTIDQNKEYYIYKNLCNAMGDYKYELIDNDGNVLWYNEGGDNMLFELKNLRFKKDLFEGINEAIKMTYDKTEYTHDTPDIFFKKYLIDGTIKKGVYYKCITKKDASKTATGGRRTRRKKSKRARKSYRHRK
jgi:hypothetical protein